MIAFACSVSEPEPYIRYAEPGIRRAAEPDSEVLAFAAVDTISRSYNLLLDAGSRHDDLEALVIVHPHAEINDAELCAKVRQALRDPEVAVVGCAGATGVRSIAWWDGSISAGAVTHAYTDHGGGRLPGFPWTTTGPPWAVRNVRFDEELTLGHGYDVDYCLQVRAAGRKVIAADLDVIEHRSLEVISDLELWVESHIAVSRKWADRMPGSVTGGETPWKERARRAEAEREAARAVAYFKRLGLEARVDTLERAMEEATSTVSWRLTAPLRRINMWRRARGKREADQPRTRGWR